MLQKERTYLWVWDFCDVKSPWKEALSVCHHSIFCRQSIGEEEAPFRTLLSDADGEILKKKGSEQRPFRPQLQKLRSLLLAPLRRSLRLIVRLVGEVVVNAEAELRKRQKLLFSSQLRRHLKKVASSREPEEPKEVEPPPPQKWGFWTIVLTKLF